MFVQKRNDDHASCRGVGIYERRQMPRLAHFGDRKLNHRPGSLVALNEQQSTASSVRRSAICSVSILQMRGSNDTSIEETTEIS